MTAPEYRFISRWKVLGSPDEVAAILRDGADLPRWWPAVYLAAEESAPGGADGVGRRVRLHTKGWLPYTLRWELTVTESRGAAGFSVSAAGDLAGEGRWIFTPVGAWTLVEYDWRVRAEKPLLKILSPVFRPILAWNHRWAMRVGEESLRRELARRRAATPEERDRIPPPPGPTTSSPLPLLAGVAVAAVLLGGVVRVIFGGPRTSGRGRGRRRR
jgi:Polyketide cyclase / dehydrase and lipid transport